MNRRKFLGWLAASPLLLGVAKLQKLWPGTSVPIAALPARIDVLDLKHWGPWEVYPGGRLALDGQTVFPTYEMDGSFLPKDVAYYLTDRATGTVEAVSL